MAVQISEEPKESGADLLQVEGKQIGLVQTFKAQIQRFMQQFHRWRGDADYFGRALEIDHDQRLFAGRIDFLDGRQNV